MKIRIKDSTVRFRITLNELEELGKNKEVVCETIQRSPSDGSLEGSFDYGARISDRFGESQCVFESEGIFFYLTSEDYGRLKHPSTEGIYTTREAVLTDGSVHPLHIVDREGQARREM